MGRWTQVSSADTNPEEEAALRMLDARLALIGARERERQARSNMWLAHHWPEHYHERCVRIGNRHVCRRCAALYPLGLLVAIASFNGLTPWPTSIDPLPIWLLSIPATIAYCAEAIGMIGYNAKVQVATTLIAAVAFGHALSYEFAERWSPEFWGPICVFGGIWFVFTALGAQRRKFAR